MNEYYKAFTIRALKRGVHPDKIAGLAKFAGITRDHAGIKPRIKHAEGPADMAAGAGPGPGQASGTATSDQYEPKTKGKQLGGFTFPGVRPGLAKAMNGISVGGGYNVGNIEQKTQLNTGSNIANGAMTPNTNNGLLQPKQVA